MLLDVQVGTLVNNIVGLGGLPEGWTACTGGDVVSHKSRLCSKV